MRNLSEFYAYIHSVVELGKMFGVPVEIENIDPNTPIPSSITIRIYQEYLEEVTKNANP